MEATAHYTTVQCREKRQVNRRSTRSARRYKRRKIKEIKIKEENKRTRYYLKQVLLPRAHNSYRKSELSTDLVCEEAKTISSTEHSTLPILEWYCTYTVQNEYIVYLIGYGNSIALHCIVFLPCGWVNTKT